MTNLRKNSIRELLEIDKGITTLFTVFLSDTDNQFNEDEMFNVWRVLKLQSNIQSEILSRLSFQTLETSEGKGEAK